MDYSYAFLLEWLFLISRATAQIREVDSHQPPATAKPAHLCSSNVSRDASHCRTENPEKDHYHNPVSNISWKIIWPDSLVQPRSWKRWLHSFWCTSGSPVSVPQSCRRSQTAVNNVCRSQSSCYHFLPIVSTTSASVLGTTMVRGGDDGRKSSDIGERPHWMGRTHGHTGSGHFTWCWHWSSDKDEDQTGVRGPSAFLLQKWKTIRKCKEMQKSCLLWWKESLQDYTESLNFEQKLSLFLCRAEHMCACTLCSVLYYVSSLSH